MREKGKLTDLEIKQAMREIRIALLEADVNFQVVRDFINRVSEKASGEDILKGLNSTQQVIKIVNDELIALMGSTHSKLAVADRPPTIIMMCGLQGAGKTTMCGKLAGMLKKQNKKVMLAACDVYRPAAIKQLQVVGGKVNVPVFEEGQINPVKIAKDALDEAKRQGADVLIIDTAGRLHIDEQLMEELQKIKAEVKPDEILLVVDSMTGQDAVNVAETFNQKLDITGVIITKLDGDTRGGAAQTHKIRRQRRKDGRYRAVLSRPYGKPNPWHGRRSDAYRKGTGSVFGRRSVETSKEDEDQLFHSARLPESA